MNIDDYMCIFLHIVAKSIKLSVGGSFNKAD